MVKKIIIIKILVLKIFFILNSGYIYFLGKPK